MVFDFDAMKATMATKGYTMIDYTTKIKKIDDFTTIEDKLKKTNNGAFIYAKTIIVIRMDAVVKKIPMLKRIFVACETPIGIRILHKDNNLSFDNDESTPNAIVIERFLTQGEEVVCEVCCEQVKPNDLSYCNNCVYNCCNSCFDKKYIMSVKAGKPDGRCFGCRLDIVFKG